MSNIPKSTCLGSFEEEAQFLVHCDSTVLSDRHHLHKCMQCAQQCCHADHAAWDSHQLLRDNPEHGAVW